jgi:cobalamin biosynthesis protein CobT
MQKEIQRLIVARSHAVMIPGFRRGRINSTALHRVPCGDDRVFRKKQEAVTNKVAVTLLIDNSGSMAGGKIETAMKAAWAFAETLDRLKIPCDVLGFTNCGFPAGFDRYTARDEIDKMIDDTGINPRCLRLNPTYIPIYKGFDEKFGPAQKRRMAHLIENQGILSANNDAKALEYAGARLHQRTETRKIMIVFSDGQPADAVDDRILKATTKANVKRLEHEGVEVIGIGIQTDAVKDYYAKHHVLNDVTDLPVFVMQQLKGLLAPKH